jgi:hypothetical protein
LKTAVEICRRYRADRFPAPAREGKAAVLAAIHEHGRRVGEKK